MKQLVGFVFSNLGLIIGICFLIFLGGIVFIILDLYKKNSDISVNKPLLYKFGTILDVSTYSKFITMNEQMQWQFMQEQIRQMNEQQMNDLLYQMNLQQQEMASLMATGIEFGGFNPDLNLNPTMQMEQQHQTDMMNHMNDNNFGGSGMF